MIGKSVLIMYKEAPEFRTYHADGVFGGATPNGTLTLAFYSEAPARPTQERLVIGEQGASQVEADLIRTYHAQFLMPPGVAIALHAWLGQHLAELRKARGGEDMI